MWVELRPARCALRLIPLERREGAPCARIFVNFCGLFVEWIEPRPAEIATSCILAWPDILKLSIDAPRHRRELEAEA
jgi:hypothetical protein